MSEIERLREENAYFKRLITGASDIDPAWNLNRKQTRVMAMLMQNRPCAKSVLIEALYWDEDEPDKADDIIESVISRLRRKIARLGYEIRNARHLGYYLAGRAAQLRRGN